MYCANVKFHIIPFQSKSIWFMPWLLQQVVDLFIGVGMFLIHAIAGVHYSVLDILFFVAGLGVTTYFTYAVLSHYILLRRMDKHSTEVINSVMSSE